MKFTIDPWDPAYGAGVETELTQSRVEPDVTVEMPAAQWAPCTPDPRAVVPDAIVFVDGVRRVEARTWIEEPDGNAVPGIFASYAAGAIRCDGAATIVDVQVGTRRLRALDGARRRADRSRTIRRPRCPRRDPARADGAAARLHVRARGPRRGAGPASG